jgi:hypothetical protein
MAWNDTYRSDLRTHRHHIPPQLPETRGIWMRATIPQYFRNEIINAVTIKAPTLDYFKRYHSKNWHNKAIRWPKAFRVATDVGEGIYEIRSPWVNFTDLSGQKSGPNRTIDYYDAYGNRVTDPSLIPDTFDLEQARFRSVAWYPGAVAYRVQFPQFDEVLVGTDAWNEHVEKVIQMEIMQKSQAMNVRLWDQSREAYVLDYDPDFTTQTTANPMSWGSIPYYINSIAWYRTSEAGKIFLRPINEAGFNNWLRTLLGTRKDNWTALRNALNSTSFWYDSSAETVTVDSANVRQQTVGSVNRGVADVPDNRPVKLGIMELRCAAAIHQEQLSEERLVDGSVGADHIRSRFWSYRAAAGCVSCCTGYSGQPALSCVQPYRPRMGAPSRRRLPIQPVGLGTLVSSGVL